MASCLLGAKFSWIAEIYQLRLRARAVTQWTRIWWNSGVRPWPSTQETGIKQYTQVITKQVKMWCQFCCVSLFVIQSNQNLGICELYDCHISLFSGIFQAKWMIGRLIWMQIGRLIIRSLISFFHFCLNFADVFFFFKSHLLHVKVMLNVVSFFFHHCVLWQK